MVFGLMYLDMALQKAPWVVSEGQRYGWLYGWLQQRSERTRREQRIAATPHHLDSPRKLTAEPAQQRRLTDPGLTRYDRDPTPARRGHLSRQAVQHAQLLRALEQSLSIHGRIVRACGRPLIGKAPYLPVSQSCAAHTTQAASRDRA